MTNIFFVKHKLRPAFLGLLASAIFAMIFTTPVYADAYQATPTRIQREWRYLKERCQAAAKNHQLRNFEEYKKVLGEIKSVNLTVGKDELERKYAVLSAKVFKLLHPETEVFVSFSSPFERLQPQELPPIKPVSECEITILAGEYQAIGMTLTNGNGVPVKCSISISGLNPAKFSFVIRKQEFIEDYYTRENERLVDPLPRLPEEKGSWTITLKGGEIVKLCVIVKTADDLDKLIPGRIKKGKQFIGIVKITMSNGQSVDIPLKIIVLPVPKPPAETFPFLMFARLKSSSFMAKSPELSAMDLKEHGVTMMQINVLPNAIFTSEGEILSIDFAEHDKILKAYGPHLRRFLIHWPAYPYTGFKTTDGSKLKYKSDAWKKAYVNLLKAWYKHVVELGMGQERFVHLPDDEAASSNLSKAPTERVLFTKKLIDMTRTAVPDATLVTTICDYAFPEDVRLLIPAADIVPVALPYRFRLPRNAPPSYNPQNTLKNVVWPLLKDLEKKGKVQPWSYHCSSGKKGNVLTFYRAWPITQVGMGRQGTGHWAYDDIGGSSWVDTDGKRLDFLFNYDGTEKNPINEHMNPTKEILVPSIRYEALRAGLQDARILMDLKKILESKKCSRMQTKGIKKLLAEARAYEKNTETVTHEKVDNFSRRLRKIYSILLEDR